MAINVRTGDTQVVSTVVKNPTVVKRVTVGTPIRSVSLAGASTLAGLVDVNVDSNLQDADVLQYVLADNRWRNVNIRAEIDSDLNILQVQIAGNDSDIAALISTDSDLYSTLAVLQAEVDSDGLRIAEIAVSLDSARSNIETLSFAIADNDSDIADLQAADITLGARLDSSENLFGDRITQNDSDILALQQSLGLSDSDDDAAIADLQTQIDSNESMFRAFHDSAESAFRSADSNLQAQIDSADAYVAFAVDSLETSITTEATLRAQADSVITSSIDSNRASTLAITSDLQTQVDSNEAFFRGVIGADSDARVAADANLQAQIDSNEGMFRGFLDSAETAREQADSNLQTNINTAQAAIDSNAADIVDLRSSDVTINARIDSNELQTAALFDSAVAVDQSLQAQIVNNDSDISSLQTQVDSNESLSKATDAALLAQVVANDSDIGDIQAQVDSNESLSKATDANLLSQIVGNDSDIATLQTQVDSNESLSKATDAALRAQLDSADTYLRGRITTVQTNVDSNASDVSDLQDQVDSNENLSKATDASLLAQILSNDSDILVLQGSGVDSAQVTSIVQPLIDSNASDISSINSTIAGFTFQAQIDSNAGDINSINSTIAGFTFQAQIDSNALDISDEVAARLAGDGTLQSQIDSISSTIASFTFQAQIDSNAGDINSLFAADNTLQSNIDSNAGDISSINSTIAGFTFQAQIDSNALDISNEVTARTSAVSGLQTQIDSNESLSKATDASLLANANSRLSTAYLNESRTIGDADSASLQGITAYFLNAGLNAPPGMNHSLFTQSYSTEWSVQLAGDWRSKDLYLRTQEGAVWKSWAKIWHEDNDGDSSGLDADLLDGQHASAFAAASHTHTIANVTGLQAALDSNASDISGLQTQVVNNDSDILALQNEPAGAIDDVFYENAQSVSADYTILSTRNAMSAGPILIDSGVTVTIDSGGVWTIV